MSALNEKIIFRQITFSQSTDVPSGEGFTNSTKINVDNANTSLASSEHNLFQQKIIYYSRWSWI